MSDKPIRALLPRGTGHQFLVYGDACSGVPGGRHEDSFAAINAAVRRLAPGPEFIVFLGDEVIGLTADEAALREQWRHWIEVETAWIDRAATAVFHTTSNHATYDVMSERVFADVLRHLPRNGPPLQQGLAYHVRRGDLLMVFVHTSAMALGGEGHVETDWLRSVLSEHADARHKLVLGHHPVFPVNGFEGSYQREIGHEYADTFWDILVDAGVEAYLCSHILAFDVQVHRGVLQVTTAGAGTKHRMPEGIEYLHFVQMALDETGMRYQVLDAEGRMRESLSWPPSPVSRDAWTDLSEGPQPAPRQCPAGTVLRFLGEGGWHAPEADTGAARTLLEAWTPGPAMPPLWIGLTGPMRRLTVSLAPEAGRSPHAWFGPTIPDGAPFDLSVALVPEMGPGGVLARLGADGAWSTLKGASAWGPERLPVCARWSVAVGRDGEADRPFGAAAPRASWAPFQAGL